MQRVIFPQIESNLHTHSHYCGHGSGEVNDYVTSAVDEGISLLGFSEHAPFVDDRYHSTRMAYAKQPAYEADVRAAQESATRVTILLGYECDYHRTYHSYLAELGERVDYLIGGVHYLNQSHETDWPVYGSTMDKKALHRYADRYVAMLQSGIFLFGVHPDLFCHRYHSWDSETIAISKAIIECAIAEGVALEINGYGLQKLVVPTTTGKTHGYPNTDFWHLAGQYPDLVAVSSSDAHKPGDIGYGRIETAALAKEAGLKIASYQITGKTLTLV